MGFDTSDDACVYRITDEIAAIHTVDFFTPIVDDPFWFGQIAAANALSDVYAMGGRPAVAMNLLCVPGCLSQETIRKILEGGHQKAVEAGCVIAGGHTIQDDEPKYGLCVTGYVHPDKALRNVGARPGDALVLTKPLGTGVLTTAAKADLLEPEQYDRLVRSMARLNAHAAEMGIIPAGAYRNLDYVKPRLTVAESVQQARVDLISDPQTSGGLLVALPMEDAGALLAALRERDPDSAIIGAVVAQTEHTLEIV